MTRLTSLAGAVTLAVALVLITSCGGGSSGRDPGLAHVHGLGVDPADGTLYAATHFGVFRVPEQGAPTRVGDLRQDTMGFTVAGPNHFLGSGHPEGGGNLGLIESTDAGKTWNELSLGGEADFHALEFAHVQVYGYDGRRGLIVSRDMRAWEQRAKVPMADLAVSPQSPDVLVATTQRGPAKSEDGGRTFNVIDGAPTLFFVSWPVVDALYGVTESGAILVSTDGGTSWQQRGSLEGGPVALIATDANTVYAATETGIYASTDGGRSFTARYQATE